jgi:hypothetical protein
VTSRHCNRFGLSQLEEGDTGDNWLLDEAELEGTTTGDIDGGGWCAAIGETLLSD